VKFGVLLRGQIMNEIEAYLEGYIGKYVVINTPSDIFFGKLKFINIKDEDAILNEVQSFIGDIDNMESGLSNCGKWICKPTGWRVLAVNGPPDLYNQTSIIVNEQYFTRVKEIIPATQLAVKRWKEG
jgi:hypothetical protein